MSEKNEPNLSEMHIKSRLNVLWSELQTNLPEINFDADDDEVLTIYLTN